MRKLALLLLLLLIPTLATANAPCINRLVARTLLQHALRGDEVRESMTAWDDFFRLYKNEPRFSAWLNHFSKDELATIHRNDFPSEMVERWRVYSSNPSSQVIEKIESRTFKLDLKNDGLVSNDSFKRDDVLDDYINRNMHRESTLKNFPPDTGPSKYDMMVVNLKKGDTVEFEGDSTKYVLGDFIGSGNATHIFECASCPDDSIVRVPFLSEFLMHPLDHHYRKRKTLGYVFDYASKYDKLKKSGVNMIDVDVSKAPYGFIIAKKVVGRTQGDHFFKSICAKLSLQKQIFMNETQLQAMAVKLEDAGHLEDSKKLLSLTEQALKIENIHQKGMGDLEQFFRQFLWDETNSRWVLIDWE